MKVRVICASTGGGHGIGKRGGMNPRAGLSMIEVMAAIVVLLIASSAAFMSQLTSMRMVEQSSETAVAVSDLEACMDRVRSSPMDSLAIPGSTYEQDVNVATYDDLHLRDQRIVVSYPDYVPAGPLPDPLRIVLTATWTDKKGGERLETLQTARVQ